DPGIDGPERLKIGSINDILQYTTHLERVGSPAASDHEAAQFAGMQRCGEQCSRGSDVRGHNMWRVQPPLVDDSDEELTHRLRRQQVVPALGLAEARKVNGKEVRVLRKRLPDRQERIQALWPGIRQQNAVVLTLVALHIPDGDSVHSSEPNMHDFARRGAHSVLLY